jgi:LytS/YehU family sensor histidine kinase
MAIICFVVLFAAGVTINYYAATAYYAVGGLHAKGPLLLAYLNTLWAMIISGFAIGIKVIRKWYREQHEVHNILRDKTRNDLNLRKRKMHPAFLYSSLESIRQKLQSGSGDASSRILTLSGLLSYSLYGTENETIALADEISAVNDFIELENIERNKISLRIDPQVDVQRLLIPPMTIFSCLQESFLKIRNSEVDECLTEIVVKVMDGKVLIQVRFSGDCAEREIVEPVFIRVPEVYAPMSKMTEYDPA